LTARRPIIEQTLRLQASMLHGQDGAGRDDGRESASDGLSHDGTPRMFDAKNRCSLRE